MCWGIEGKELPKARDTPAPGEGNLVGLLHRVRDINPPAFWFPPEQHWDLVDQSPACSGFSPEQYEAIPCPTAPVKGRNGKAQLGTKYNGVAPHPTLEARGI